MPVAPQPFLLHSTLDTANWLGLMNLFLCIQGKDFHLARNDKLRLSQRVLKLVTHGTLQQLETFSRVFEKFYALILI
jgi:hypothetical protein